MLGPAGLMSSKVRKQKARNQVARALITSKGDELCTALSIVDVNNCDRNASFIPAYCAKCALLVMPSANFYVVQTASVLVINALVHVAVKWVGGLANRL